MKNVITYIALIASLIFFIATLISCGDGQLVRPFGGLQGNQAQNIGGNEPKLPTYECVDVTSYKNVKAVDVQSTLAGKEESTSSIRKCVRDEIKKIRAVGSEFYWQNMTWLVIRNSISKKPEKNDVQIIEFESCEQIKEYDCLLTK